MRPSVHDQNNGSYGLCGQLNGNLRDDFQFKNGTQNPENKDDNKPMKTFPNHFIDEWRQVLFYDGHNQ